MVLFSRCILFVMVFCVLGLAPRALAAANLLSHTTYTDADGRDCEKWSYDDGSDAISCNSSETEIIDVPVPALTDEAVPEGFSGEPSPTSGASTSPEQGNYKEVPEDYGRKAREKMGLSKERAEEHLGYEEVISEPTERDPDFGMIGEPDRRRPFHSLLRSR